MGVPTPVPPWPSTRTASVRNAPKDADCASARRRIASRYARSTVHPSECAATLAAMRGDRYHGPFPAICHGRTFAAAHILRTVDGDTPSRSATTDTRTKSGARRGPGMPRWYHERTSRPVLVITPTARGVCLVWKASAGYGTPFPAPFAPCAVSQDVCRSPWPAAGLALSVVE